MAGIIRARRAGEQALRDCGAPYSIVRPSWLTDAPASGVHLEQGDHGDGRVSRETVAQAAVAALLPRQDLRTLRWPTPADWTSAVAAPTVD
ncbi:NAD(P)H-binding protein [Nocardia acidivorans]|uniref:NAD(P)H-binding protein n=1 Tax=Nocardia acidivorans TaxID=404580 RepID=UPI00082DE902|nr:NAD(P)H-binding protein [Nocardia acidivorans]